MSDANRVGLYSLAEATWGTTPASALTQMRYLSETLGYNIQSRESEEIRPDRNTTDIYRTGAEAGGDVNFEFSPETYDEWLRGLMCQTTWTTDDPIAGEDSLVNGTSKQSFTLEKHIAGATTPQFLVYKGMRVGGMQIGASIGEAVSGTWSFKGKSEAIASATAGTGAATAANTNAILTAASNITGIKEGGITLTDDIQKFSLSIQNNLRTQGKVGQLAARGIGLGGFKVTGSIEIYFENGTLYTKYLNQTDTSLQFTLSDGAGSPKEYDFILPKVELSNGRALAGGRDSDIMASFDFTAKYDSGIGGTLKIVRRGI